jgi:hypothetical protein
MLEKSLQGAQAGLWSSTCIQRGYQTASQWRAWLCLKRYADARRLEDKAVPDGTGEIKGLPKRDDRPVRTMVPETWWPWWPRVVRGAGVGVDEPTRESLAILAPAPGVPVGWAVLNAFHGSVLSSLPPLLGHRVRLPWRRSTPLFRGSLFRLVRFPVAWPTSHIEYSVEMACRWRWCIGTPVLSQAHGYCDGVDDCGKW